MDLIDRLIFTATNIVKRTNGGPDIVPILSPGNIQNLYVDVPDPLLAPVLSGPAGGPYRYPRDVRHSFVTIEDTSIIENSVQKHWFDLVDGRSYPMPVGPDDG